MEEVIVQGIQL